MAGLTPDISTSSFKPLNLQEIMMVPLAKQKMEDEFLANADKYNDLSAQVLDPDKERAQQAVDYYKGQASQMAGTVIDKGISRAEINKLRKLRGEMNKEFGQEGFTGNAIANQKRAMQFVNDLATKKESQAGWSPSRAKEWAMSQVSQFEGTDDGLGGLRGFQGRGLQSKIDRNKWINEKLKNISSDASEIALNSIRVGGLGAFQKAFRDGQVEKKEYNKIMRSLVTQAKNDNDLMMSLKQEGVFTGEKNPEEIGDFIIQKDPRTGKNIETFVPKSSFGGQIAGAGMGAQFRKVKTDYRILNDAAAFEMSKMGLERSAASNYVSASSGELYTVPPENLDQLRETIDLAKNSIEQLKYKIDNYSGDKNSRDFKELFNSYRDSKLKNKNAESRLNGATEIARKKLSPDQKKMLELNNEISLNGGSPVELAKSLGMEDVDTNTRYGKLNELKLSYEFLLKNKNIKGSKDDLLSISNNFNEEIHNELKNNPMSYKLTVLGGESSGKYSSATGAAQKRVNDNFNENNYITAYEGESMRGTEERIIDEYDVEKVIKSINFTANTDSSGYPIEVVTYKDAETGRVLETVSATRGNLGRIEAREIANELSSSRDPEKQKMGVNMIIDNSIMPQIKRANIYGGGKHSYIPGLSLRNKKTQNLDQIGIESSKSTLGTDTFYITKNGERLNQNEYKSERELANALYLIMPKQ